MKEKIRLAGTGTREKERDRESTFSHPGGRTRSGIACLSLPLEARCASRTGMRAIPEPTRHHSDPSKGTQQPTIGSEQ